MAERFAWRARLPLVIVVCGVPAAGKSHLALALAEVSGLPHLSSDVTRKRLAGIRPRQRAASAAYSAEFNLLTYCRARPARGAGRRPHCGGAIVDATFRHRADRDAFADAFGTRRRRCSSSAGRPRACSRSELRSATVSQARVSDASLAVVMRESSAWEPLDELPPEAHVTLRSDRPVEAQLEDLRALLDRRMGQLPTRWDEP